MMKHKKKVLKIKVMKLTEEELDDLGLGGEENGWWLNDPNNPCSPYIGPYTTKAEAQEEKRGLEKFWRYHA